MFHGKLWIFVLSYEYRRSFVILFQIFRIMEPSYSLSHSIKNLMLPFSGLHCCCFSSFIPTSLSWVFFPFCYCNCDLSSLPFYSVSKSLRQWKLFLRFTSSGLGTNSGSKFCLKVITITKWRWKLKCSKINKINFVAAKESSQVWIWVT